MNYTVLTPSCLSQARRVGVTVFLLLLAVPMARAQMSETFSYQGYLLDTEGTPVTGTLDLTFTLYLNETNSAQIWQETQQDVVFSDGVFSVRLGSVESLSGLPFDRSLWLGMSVEGSAELMPRVALSAVPYALHVRGLRVEPASDPSEDGPNVISGWSGNSVAEGVVGATIAGGGERNVGPNEVSAEYGVIGGGQGNTVSGISATVGGGIRNTAGDRFDFVGGGRSNAASGGNAAVGGGRDNTASGQGAAISGGEDNTAGGLGASVSGGRDNEANGTFSAVGGGDTNWASGGNATVPGGKFNRAGGVLSFAAGYNARAAHQGTFVWSDYSRPLIPDSLVSTGENQFLIRAIGGVGIGTNAPSSPLTVAGVIESTEGGFLFPDGTVQTTAASGSGTGSNAGWQLGGNTGTTASSDFIGTTDGEPLEIRVNGARVMRYELAGDPVRDAPNVIGGVRSNHVADGVVGATIAGGGHGISSNQNQVTADYGTVGGGLGNKASGLQATVGGGVGNKASGKEATVGGGVGNKASGAWSTVSGGYSNQARSQFSFAAGVRARAAHDGAFVWNDSYSRNPFDSLVTTAANQFLIEARGGVGIGTNRPQGAVHITTDSGPQPHLLLEETNNSDYARLRLKNTSSAQFWDVAAGAADTEQLNFFASHGRGNVMSLRASGDPLVMHNGAKLTAGGTWTNASSRALKTDFEAVDGQEVLSRLAGLSIQTWRYKAEAGVRHMGPTAEAFAAAFGLGDTSEAIATVDADGVALAAIQALHQTVEALRQQVSDQQEQIRHLKARLDAR